MIGTSTPGKNNPPASTGTRPRRVRNAAVAGALGAVAALGLSGCGLGSASDNHESTSFDAPSGRLVIESDYDLEVAQHGGKDVEVERWMSEDRNPSWELSGDTLELSADDDGWMPDFGSPPRGEVRVPEGAAVEVRIPNGDVTVTGLEDTRVQSTNGDVTIADATGEVEVRGTNGDIGLDSGKPLEKVSLRTTNGDITMDTALPPGEVELRTKSGDLTARLPGDATYDVRADTGSGDVRVDVPQRSDGRTIDLANTSGDINVDAG